MDFLPAVMDADETHMHLAHVEPGGTLGRHLAPRTQLFAVVAGAGEVAGTDGVRSDLTAGHAVTWDVGEEHESWASTAMVVAIVETDGTFELDRFETVVPASE